MPRGRAPILGADKACRDRRPGASHKFKISRHPRTRLSARSLVLFSRIHEISLASQPNNAVSRRRMQHLKRPRTMRSDMSSRAPVADVGGDVASIYMYSSSSSGFPRRSRLIIDEFENKYCGTGRFRPSRQPCAAPRRASSAVRTPTHLLPRGAVGYLCTCANNAVGCPRGFQRSPGFDCGLPSSLQCRKRIAPARSDGGKWTRCVEEDESLQ